MVSNPPEGVPRLSPYVLYEDAGGAVDWLVKTFGFVEKSKMEGEGGAVVHAELSFGGDGGGGGGGGGEDCVLMLGCPGPEYRCPKNSGHGSVMLYVYVDDVDAHYEVAKAAGAEILSEPAYQFYGDRAYRAKDLEGHEWGFGTHVKDVAVEDMEGGCG